MTKHEELKAAYAAAYAVVKARHDANEAVSVCEQRRLGEAEMALTDYEIANGLFKGFSEQ